MSPPEVWGPPVWRLFHTLSERINDHAYPYIYTQLFVNIKRICSFLPCPECSNDATIFLAKININELKTKSDFKNMIYLFHNYVNSKKKKPLFNHTNLEIYKKYKLMDVINSFLLHYNTKGNLNLITESFQRQFVIKDFRSWITRNIRSFIAYPQVSPQNITIVEPPIKTPVETQVEPQVEPVETPVELLEEAHEDQVATNDIHIDSTITVVSEPVNKKKNKKSKK